MPSPSITEQALTEPVQPAPVYPSARYFQIHFEFLQQQLQQTLNLLESLQTQMRQLEQQTAHCKARQDIYAVPLQSLAAHQDSLSRPPRDSTKAGRR
ncbi:hypothetical protein [Methylomonas rivi]|uniref:SlyX protein n=1 Tax=Methylomonas rivi TaxID=2952226 RepID=A0ABT1UB12_9GAMM|nr:hypothetical protein [Methylomonas sp. WSC-6]MBS4049715.1 hypothetical protein [Methylomonas sp.]MCQ8130713.1 hypothetical protein [Methylomonas sp. WSC-6]